MITNCANRMCGQPFRFFRGGKLFIVDVPSNPGSGNSSSTDQGPRKLEHLWLCEPCAATMTLVVKRGGTPRVILQTSEDRPANG